MMKAFKIVVSDDTGQEFKALACGLPYLDALLCLPLLAEDFAQNAPNVFFLVHILPDF